jgi:hypothetical protein
MFAVLLGVHGNKDLSNNEKRTDSLLRMRIYKFMMESDYMAENKIDKKIDEEDIKKNPEKEDEEDEEGLASSFGKIMRQKLSSSRKKRMVEVE